MKVSLNWLKKYLNNVQDLSAKEIVDKLTGYGLETFIVKNSAENIKDIVIAEVLECDKHPDADKLSVCKISTGDKIHDVVCGAKNIRKGLKIAFAPLNSVLPGNFKIKKTKIRGVESNGMVCSESELELSEESEGIMELSSDAPVGKPFAKTLGYDDILFEIELTPDRGDCLSYLGVAREVAAIFNGTVKYPERGITSRSSEKSSNLITIENNEKEICHRYMGKVIKNITIKESPEWLREDLVAHGLTPINNVVDATNYILLETGQPLHAFDLNLLNDSKIIIRKATEGEKFMALDDKEYELSSNDLVIADSKVPVALAGVIGGKDSSINEKTTDILLECAYFYPANVRESSNRHGITTDSSVRFEKGRDILAMEDVLESATALILEIAGGQALEGHVDQNFSSKEKVSIELSKQKIESILGVQISLDKITELLTNVETLCEKVDDDKLRVTPPTSRLDLLSEIDFSEEIIRLYGFDKVPEVPLSFKNGPKSTNEAFYLSALDIKKLASKSGFHETINYSFTSPEILKTFGLEEYALGDKTIKKGNSPLFTFQNFIKIKNPLSNNWSVMRPALFTSLYENLKTNLSFQHEDIRLFEVANIFGNKSKDESVIDSEESLHLSLLGYGRQNKLSHFYDNNQKIDFFELKGVAENIFKELDISKVSFKKNDKYKFLHPGKSAIISIFGNEEVGFIGEVHPKISNKDKLDSVWVLELNLSKMIRPKKTPKYKHFSKYPYSQRDIAVLIDKSVSYEQITQALNSIKENKSIVKSTTLFDLFESDKLPENKKSIGVRQVIQSDEKTLKLEEVDKAFNLSIQTLMDKLGATLR